MGSQTLSLGLTLTVPTSGTRNWASSLYSSAWTKISQHSHTGSGDGNQIPTGGIEDNSITTVKLSKIIGQTAQTPTAPSGTTFSANFTLGNVINLSLASATGDVTVSFSISTGSANESTEVALIITQGATPRNIVWPASIKWANGVAPILSTANGAIDIVRLRYVGSTYYGDWDVAYATA